ncbi:ribonuclease H-like domain-containing protein [Tanacetum coccineum]
MRRLIVRNTARMTYSHAVKGNWGTADHPLKNIEDRGIFDSGCSGHMTGNKDYLDDFEECKGGSVTFGGSKGYITGKGRIKIPDENQILLKVPRQHNMYSFDMKTPSLTKDYACLIAKDTSDKSKLWHRRLGHINFRNLNKLVKGNLVRGLPSKVFRNDHTCVACHKDLVRVKIIRSDNGTEFKNRDMLEFCTLQTPNTNASEEEDEDEELIVVPIAVKHTAAKVGPRKSSTNSKEEKFLTELQNLQTQEKEAFSAGILEDTPEILAFRRDLDQLAQKHLREVTTDKATSTNSVNSGSKPANTQPADQDDSDMPELTIFNKPQKGIFDEASYDEEGMEEPKKIYEALKDDSWVKAMQEELLQFRLQQVWILVDLPHGAKVIGTK